MVKFRNQSMGAVLLGSVSFFAAAGTVTVGYVGGVKATRLVEALSLCLAQAAISMVAWYVLNKEEQASRSWSHWLPWILLAVGMVQVNLRLFYLQPSDSYIIPVVIGIQGMALWALAIVVSRSSRSVTPLIPKVNRSATSDKKDALPRASVDPEIADHAAVIKSVRRRSNEAADLARFSMVVMIALVTLGGIASVGLWFMGHRDRVRLIERERENLRAISDRMQYVVDKWTASDPQSPSAQELAKSVSEIQDYVRKNYGKVNVYERLLEDIRASTQVNWPDIAIRATIALLTIILVQVFFSVYKYNRHLASILASKAEALQLIGSEADARKALRRELIVWVKEGVPDFGKSPSTPVQEVADILQKFREALSK